MQPDTSDTPIRLSVLIRTLNEADRIAATIRSALPLRAEILVIDAGSSDATAAIAESLGARVIVNPWEGFGPQRRFGEAQCAHDFVLCLDADEVMTPESVAEIRALMLRPDPPRLMIIPKAMILPHHRRPPPFPFCTRQIYLYDRRVARTELNPNWDKLAISTGDRPHRLKSVIWHYTFRDWHHAVAKANYVTQLAADTQEKKPEALLLLRVVVEFPLSFLRFYLLRRLFLAGIDGIVMATILAFGRFLRIAKMWEAGRRRALAAAPRRDDAPQAGGAPRTSTDSGISGDAQRGG